MRELSNEPKLFEIGPQSSKNEPDQKIQITFFFDQKKKLKEGMHAIPLSNLLKGRGSIRIFGGGL